MIKITKQPIKVASCTDADSVFFSQNFTDGKHSQIIARAGDFCYFPDREKSQVGFQIGKKAR